MTRNADLQTPGFLKDSTSDWSILEMAWLGKGRRTMCFGVDLKGVGLNSRNPLLF